MAKSNKDLSPEEIEIKRLRWRNWYATHKEYRRLYKKQYRAEHTEQYRQYGKNRYAKAKDSIRSREFLKRYGLTVEQRDRMIASQGGTCASCGTSTPTKKGWMIDHDHETGEIRGVLCGKCNSALGLLNDSLEKAIKLVAYLRKYKTGPAETLGNKSSQDEDSNILVNAAA